MKMIIDKIFHKSPCKIENPLEFVWQYVKFLMWSGGQSSARSGNNGHN